MKSVLIFCVLIFSQYSSALIIEKVVAVVNDEPILQSEIVDYRNKLKSDALIDKAILSFKDEKELLRDQAKLIDHLIDEKLIDHEIKKLNLTVPFERVEQEIRKVTSGQGITRAQLKSTLQAKGLKFSDYQDFIKTSLERRSLIEQQIQSKIKITDEDITSFYISKYGASGSQAFEYELAHVLVLKKNGGEKLAFEKAKNALEALQSGKSFSSVAEQYSEDPAFKAGGKMGTFRTGDLRKEIENTIKTINSGQFSKIIETPFGYQIVKVLSKSLTESPQVAQQKDQIRQILMMNSIKERLLSWLEKKRQQAFIKINKT